MKDHPVHCWGLRCDNRAHGIYVVTHKTKGGVVAPLCAQCGLHDVLQSQRTIVTRPQHVKFPHTNFFGDKLFTKVELVKSLNATGRPMKAAVGEGAKHWVEDPEPKAIRPAVIRVREITTVHRKPFKPFVFRSLKDGGNNG